MPIVSCYECRAEISSLATSCPKCGAPAKPPAPKNQTKMSPAMSALGGILLILAIVAVAAKYSSPADIKQTETAAPPQAKTELLPEPIPTQEELAAKALEKKREEALITALHHIKTFLRNPDSLKLAAVRATEDGNTICLRYRAQNGYGGMTISEAVIVGTKISSAKENIRKHCQHSDLKDYTDQANVMIEILK